LKISNRSILVALGWILVQSQIQFSSLITRDQGLQPIWFLVVFLLTVQASILLEGIEETLKCWLVSLLFSVLMVFVLLSLPILFGALIMELVPIIILGSVQPVVSFLVIIAPLGLLGCFTGQIIRNKLL